MEIEKAVIEGEASCMNLKEQTGEGGKEEGKKGERQRYGRR